MSTEKGYNGWTNYETWATCLWIDNDEDSHLYWREAAQQSWSEAEVDRTFSKKERAALALADQLKDEHETAQPEVTGLWADLLNAAMSEINWYEIATSLIENVVEDEVEEG